MFVLFLWGFYGYKRISFSPLGTLISVAQLIGVLVILGRQTPIDVV